MQPDTFKYIVAFLITAVSAHYTKLIDNGRTRKVCASWIGVTIMFLMLEEEVLDIFALVLVNAIIISWCDRRYVHLLCFVINWTHLIIYHVIARNLYGYLIFQSLALRLTGLASELHTADDILRQTAGFMNGVHLTSKFIVQSDKNHKEPDVLTVIHYSFNFIGLLGGPYYRWNTFIDYITLPVHEIESGLCICSNFMLEFAVWSLIYLFIDFKYPVQEYKTMEFFYDSNALYRFTYNAPRLLVYVIQYHLFCCIPYWVARSAGMGLYPVECRPQPGVGPLCKFELMHAIRHKPKLTQYQEYTAITVKTLDLHRVLTAPSLRQGLKYWDCTVQYWMWANVYRKIPCGGKNFKRAVTMSIWLLWWGFTIPHGILIATLWFYMLMENVYQKLIIAYTCGKERKILSFTMVIFRFLCVVYLYPCLVIEEAHLLISYYHSIYWFYHAVILVLLMLASYVINLDFYKDLVMNRRPSYDLDDSNEATARCGCNCDCNVIEYEKRSD